ncbi:hypothetical protein ACSAZK_13150 [Methanosarcina sp. Mfa9]|uniref:hypothetical protein n=1 Tax=Methanosarcina sp. Mfa9 TaxID=3439063 RepID=UPI003F864A35
MNLNNLNPIALVLCLCVLSVISGIVGGYVFLSHSDEEMLVGNIEEIRFSEDLLNDEIKVIIEEVNTSYPGSVEREDGDFILVGYGAIDEFDNLTFESDMELGWEFVPVVDGDVIIQDAIIQDADSLSSGISISPSQDDFLVISYEELDLLLNGDEETVEMFRDILSESGRNSSEWNESTWKFVELNECELEVSEDLED